MLHKLSTKSSNRKYKHTEETKEKLRNIRIDKLKNLYGNSWRPTFNNKACEVINEIGCILSCNFKHAKNGGETYVNIGYFLDGYDRDKNIAIEFYEREHYDSFGNLNKKTADREFNIIKHLNCKFIRVNEFNPNKLKIEILNNG